ncbi:MAG: hypothetical protein ACI4VQ_03290 [Clostridia bacterium]
MIYIISDTHFSHKNIIEYCNRPYADTNIMNKDIVEKWNSIVSPEDVVLHLGDVGFGLVEQLKPLIEGLNGHKILLKGNHDMKRGINSWTNIGFDIVYKCKELHLDNFLKDIETIYTGNITLYSERFNDIIFSHCPRQVEDNILNIHGHIHNVPLDTSLYNPENHFCASIEMIDYKPIPLSKILELKN